MYSTRCTHVNEEREPFSEFSTDTILVLDDVEKIRNNALENNRVCRGGQYLLWSPLEGSETTQE